MPRKIKKTFESELERLQEIVAALEEGPDTLDETLALFEEGVATARRLEERLAEAETKIKSLLRDENGELVLADTDEDE